jgi:hypothetical protein
MSTRAWCLCAALVVACSGTAAAQDLGLRLAAGPVWDREPGLGALAAAHVARGKLLVRADLQLTMTGASADWERSARVLTLGASAGVGSAPGAADCWYVLAAASEGLDLREADKLRALGAVAGYEAASFPLFAELRYEHWLQRGVRHYDLPGNSIRLLVGLTIL